MKATTIKGRWAAKLMRSKSFVVITDTESVIFSEHTDASKFDDQLTAHLQLSALRKFQVAINRVVREFERDMDKKFGKPKAKAGKSARKITVKAAK
jgi:hypothetical protein